MALAEPIDTTIVTNYDFGIGDRSTEVALPSIAPIRWGNPVTCLGLWAFGFGRSRRFHGRFEAARLLLIARHAGEASFAD